MDLTMEEINLMKPHNILASFKFNGLRTQYSNVKLYFPTIMLRKFCMKYYHINITNLQNE